MNSSEDLSDKLTEDAKKVKFARRRNKLKDSKVIIIFYSFMPE